MLVSPERTPLRPTGRRRANTMWLLKGCHIRVLKDTGLSQSLSVFEVMLVNLSCFYIRSNMHLLQLRQFDDKSNFHSRVFLIVAVCWTYYVQHKCFRPAASTPCHGQPESIYGSHVHENMQAIRSIQILINDRNDESSETVSNQEWLAVIRATCAPCSA